MLTDFRLTKQALLSKEKVMSRKSNAGRKAVVLSACLLTFITGTNSLAGPRQTAKQIINATAVKGGLVVVLGAGDGRLTLAHNPISLSENKIAAQNRNS